MRTDLMLQIDCDVIVLSFKDFHCSSSLTNRYDGALITSAGDGGRESGGIERPIVSAENCHGARSENQECGPQKSFAATVSE